MSERERDIARETSFEGGLQTWHRAQPTLISVIRVCFTSLLINWNVHHPPTPPRNKTWHRTGLLYCACWSLLREEQPSLMSLFKSPHVNRVSEEGIKQILHYWPASVWRGGGGVPYGTVSAVKLHCGGCSARCASLCARLTGRVNEIRADGGLEKKQNNTGPHRG